MAKKTFLIAVVFLVMLVSASLQEELDDLPDDSEDPRHNGLSICHPEVMSLGPMNNRKITCPKKITKKHGQCFIYRLPLTLRSSIK
ncbi:hypothetical protein ACROYT_G022769 [Oculina patagonica]